MNKLLESLVVVIDMAEQPHMECDLDSDTECGAEQYGDGNVGEHQTLREAKAAIEAVDRALEGRT